MRIWIRGNIGDEMLACGAGMSVDRRMSGCFWLCEHGNAVSFARGELNKRVAPVSRNGVQGRGADSNGAVHPDAPGTR